MKVLITFLSFCFLLGTVNLGYGQTDSFEITEDKERLLVKLAKQASREGSSLIALAYYKKLVELNPTKTKHLFEIAQLYRRSNDYVNAEKAYAQLADKKDDKTLNKHPETYFYWGTMLKALGKFEEAKIPLTKFKKLAKLAKDPTLRKLGKAELLGCDYAINFADTAKQYTIQHLSEEINNPHIDFSPIPLSDNELIFGSLREHKHKYYTKTQLDTIQLPTRKFYRAKKSKDGWKFQGEWEGPFNSDETDIANGCFSIDSTKFYFTKCKENWQFKTNCVLYHTSITDTGWSTPIAFDEHINLPGYTTSHPTVARDSKKGHEIIYFVSDRPGGKGRSDIWYTEYHVKKKYYQSK